MSSTFKIGVLTSSRADYGIYKPLLECLSEDEEVELHLIVFGMHVLPEHGATLKQIKEDNFGQIHIINLLQKSDSAEAITYFYGSLISEFSKFWTAKSFDWVVALGDRFEMSAAVQSLIPYQIPLAHLHGGETTLGAIDNIYRHQISLAAKLHFTASEHFKEKLTSILGARNLIYNVGALSIDGIDDEKLPEWQSVREKFQIPEGDFLLITFHPETATNKSIQDQVKAVEEALTELQQHYILVITATNADASGSYLATLWKELKIRYPEKIVLVESFGRLNYFAAVAKSTIVLGNSSSGILEVASFKKYVVNVGDRQKGRLQSDNIINVPFEASEIMNGVKIGVAKGSYKGSNVYKGLNTTKRIVTYLKKHALK